MAEARQLKQREYHTSYVISHDATRPHNSSPMRNSNTFRSTGFKHDPEPPRNNSSRKHENIFSEKKTTAQVTRASYQDSNPFNENQRATPKVVQRSASGVAKTVPTRDHNTFKSSFQEEAFEKAFGCGKVR